MPLSALIVVIGLLLVAPSFELSDAGTAGLAWAVVSGALFAALTLMNRPLVASNSFMAVAFYQQITAALVLIPLTLPPRQMPETRTLWLLLVLGVICTALPHLLFIKSLRALKAQLVSIVTEAAAERGLLSKQFGSGGGEPLWLDWAHWPYLTIEPRLSRLSREIIEAHHLGRPYGLRLPDLQIEPALGEPHRRACLTALALHGEGP